jgi:hypothetical protein
VLDFFWIGINLLVGLPIALAVWVFGRETLRSGVALAFGFRVFAIRFGVGRILCEETLGPVDLSLRSWPLAGDTLARSGVPQRHRVARAVCATAPLAMQFVWLAFRASHAPLLESALGEGPALLPVLDLANGILLGIHSFLPVEFPSGARSDVRLLIDAALTRPENDRNARANYYARFARHHLERGDVAAAEQALTQGLRQLGREYLLLRCETRLQQTGLDSVVDQGECADDLLKIIQAAEPNGATEWATSTIRQRFRQSMVSALPALFLAITALIFQTDRLSVEVEKILRNQSIRIAETQQPGACTEQFSRWSAWMKQADRWFPLDLTDQIDRHSALAQLEICRGNVAAAAAHQGEAMLFANSTLSLRADAILAEPERWLEKGLRMTELLRQAAAVENQRRSFRRALGTLGKAERRLRTLEGQVSVWPDAGLRTQAGAFIEAERHAVVALREQVLASLATR